MPERDLLASADRARHLLDRTIAERSVTPAQVDKIDHMVRLHAQACVTMPPTVMLRRLIADFDEFRWLVSQAQSPTTLVRLYACIAQIAKRRGEEAISSVTAPFLIAEMLGQAADALGGLEGRHALEIGSGGYNASLLREFVGPSGSVTTVDIDPDVTDRAAACLEAAGYDDVTAVCADAEHPIEPGRRYDLIIVTACRSVDLRDAP